MSKNTLNRRAVLAGAAATVPGTAAPALPAITEPDPTYAVIARMRATWAALDAECSQLSEAGTPEAMARESLLQDAVAEAELELSNLEPTTLAGVRDLLAYLAELQAWGVDLDRRAGGERRECRCRHRRR